MRTTFVICLLAIYGSLAAAEPRLRLTANTTNAKVGELITVTVAVVDAPAFSCFGATVLLPGPSVVATAQAAGATPTFVADSRRFMVPGARFGGYRGTNSPGDTARNHPAGTHILGQVTVRASRSGTYVLRAPSYDAQTAPFGGMLLPANAVTRVIPASAELTLTITGTAVVRNITMRQIPHFLWDCLYPVDAEVSPPAGGLQVIRVKNFEDAEIEPVQAANQ